MDIERHEDTQVGMASGWSEVATSRRNIQKIPGKYQKLQEKKLVSPRCQRKHDSLNTLISLKLVASRK